MEVVLEKHKKDKGGIAFISFFPIIMMVLAPYALRQGGTGLCDILIVGMAVYLLLIEKVFFFKPLFLLLVAELFLTLFSFLFSKSNDTSLLLAIKIFMVFALYLLVYSSIWKCHIMKSFFVFAKWSGVICAILAILQFVFASTGVNFYNGQLPFPLSKNSYFGGLFDGNTGDLRVHSFFEEPSYLAFFEIPIVIHLIQEKKYVWAGLCGVACILSGSMIGVVGLLFSVLFVLFFDSNIKKRTKLHLVIVILFMFAVFVMLYIYSSGFKELINYYLKRFSNIENSSKREDSSFSQRLAGNISLFNNYGLFNRLVGVGFNQYPLYFGLTKDYSNDIVSTLLNFGYLGIVILIFTLVGIWKKTSAHGRVFAGVLFILIAVDHSWFGSMFFYMLTWVIVKSDNRYSKEFYKICY